MRVCVCACVVVEKKINTEQAKVALKDYRPKHEHAEKSLSVIERETEVPQ